MYSELCQISKINLFVKRIPGFKQCVKSVRIRSYSGRYFPALGLNIEISPYSVQMWENTHQNNSEYEHFSRSGAVSYSRKNYIVDV